jgi:hypothetical protein
MNVTLESTTKIVELVVDGKTVPARIWEGETDTGIPVHAYITRIAVAPDHDASQFERELRRTHSEPSPSIEALPLRLIL